jgi:hypothetical protein
MATSLKPRLAFQRVADELKAHYKTGRAFATNLFELDLIEVDYDGWINNIDQQLKRGEYAPGPVEYCNAPKGHGLVRPGVCMLVADRVAYTAAVGACLKSIYAETKWSRDKVDFATAINPKGLSKRQWLLAPYRSWLAWRERSLQFLARKRTRFVVTADIAGYFENVSIGILASDLKRIGCNEDAVALIVQCLHHWAITDERGLPQGVLASDVLAKLYLASFDNSLRTAGFTHVRYTDDIRIFCESEREARQALVLVADQLRRRGLTLQSAKTKIRQAAALEQEFAGAVPAIMKLNREYIDEAVAGGLLVADPSMPVSVIDDLANVDPRKIDPEVIRRAWRKFVVRAKEPNQTMRRYLLRRFAALADDTAVEYCSKLIATNPETSTEVLRYFEDLVYSKRYERICAQVLRKKDLDMYPYQQYLVLDWFWRNSEVLGKPTVSVVRTVAFDGNAPRYVRAIAIALLGRCGDYADLERIEDLFRRSKEPLERAQLLCSLTRLEKGRRNALAGRAKNEVPWVDRATRLVRDAG